MSDEVSVYSDMRAAVRTRLLTLSKATTGALTTISVAGSTYTRTAGSFITDGFSLGDEAYVSGAGVANNNGRSLILELAATTMKVDRALSTEAAGASITLAAGLWQGRAYEGRPFTPTVGQPYIAEGFAPVASVPRALGHGGTIRHEAVVSLSLFYPATKISGPMAVERMAGAVIRHFRPGTSLVYDTTAAMVTRATPRPLVPSAEWLMIPVQVFLFAYTANV